MNAMSFKGSPFPLKTPPDGVPFDEHPRREFLAGGTIVGLFFGGLLCFAGLVPLDAGFAETIAWYRAEGWL